MDAARLECLLPWRHPFRMIDRMLDCAPNERIVTVKHVTAGDSVVAGAEGSWLPAMLVLEGLSQSAALLYVLTYRDARPERLPLLGFLDAEIDGTAAVGEVVRFDVQARKMTRSAGLFVGEAFADGRRIAGAELAFSAAAEEGG